MSGYIAGFTFYTLAIIGTILLAFVIAKKSMLGYGISKKKECFLDIEHSINIAPRKTVQVVRAGDEKFLIALDPERTTFLTKLSVKNDMKTEKNLSDKSDILDKQEYTSKNISVMRSVLKKLNI